MTSQAFCILDRRLSPRKQTEMLELLGATHIRNEDGDVALTTGSPVEESDALVMLTSGSSGTPKAVIHTWSSLIASAELTQRTLRADTAPVWLATLPPAHIGGLAVLLRHVLNDAELRWGELADGPRQGATHVSVVRTQLARHDLSGYHSVLVGGGPAPVDRGANVIATWGMTETGSGVVYDGRALPDVRVAAFNGELHVQSPTLLRAYRDRPRPEFIDESGERWFPTGDGGQVIDGKVSVFGRLGSVITTGGEKVWPEDLEALFATLNEVQDIAVTGVDDDEWGQRVVALVVSTESLDERLRSMAAAHIGPWAKPKEIRYVAAIPRTGNGKIIRTALAHLH
jgi:O-succinylbenzoic acid--CoA ligase